MPKQVDHEERRQHIAEAVLRLTSEYGLESVSLRDVAAEAKISMGRVQHYFKTKQDMILFACTYMVELAEKTAKQELQKVIGSSSPKAVIRELCLQPLKPKHQAGTRIWLAFVNKALTDPELANFFRDTWTGTRATIAEQIRLAQTTEGFSPTIDPDQEAIIIVTLLEGLMTHVVLGLLSYQNAVKLVDFHLERLTAKRTR
jgi:TetR/AcrR family transcriptional regulator, transcriptional repressor of bet genes